MKTVVLANQKGGVGKSAVATLLSQYLVREGKRVLAIDFDHQGNFSSPLEMSRRAIVADRSADQLLTERVRSLPQGNLVLVPAADPLMGLERQPTLHKLFAENFGNFLLAVRPQFDVCVIDTHPSPDIRMISAMATADFLLSPIQLNQEAIDGVRALLHHDRVGYHKIKAVLNPKLSLIGLLPTMIEPTPFQRANLRSLVQKHLGLLINMSDQPGDVARIPKRSAIAEAQAEGHLLWEMKKTAARDAWTEIEPSLKHIAATILAPEVARAV